MGGVSGKETPLLFFGPAPVDIPRVWSEGGAREWAGGV